MKLRNTRAIVHHRDPEAHRNVCSIHIHRQIDALGRVGVPHSIGDNVVHEGLNVDHIALDEYLLNVSIHETQNQNCNQHYIMIHTIYTIAPTLFRSAGTTRTPFIRNTQFTGILSSFSVFAKLSGKPLRLLRKSVVETSCTTVTQCNINRDYCNE